MAAKTSDDLRWIVVGGLVLGLYVAQWAIPIEWPWLTQIQADDTYKGLTGLAVIAYVAHQWQLSFTRIGGGRRAAAMTRHKILGAFAPVPLFFHARSFGYGYLLALGSVYLASGLVGLFNRPVIATGRKRLFAVWLISHVAVATFLVILAAYHVAIAMLYE